jgi:glucoamylase
VAADELRVAVGTHLYSKEQGRFLKGIVPSPDGTFRHELRVDASTYAPFYFDLFSPDDERVEGTMRAITEKLRVETRVGGIARYEGDRYQRSDDLPGTIPGNPWLICTLWLAQWHIARAKDAAVLDDAMKILEWVAGGAPLSGVLAEQLDPLTGRPLSVAPLTWSHATFVSTVIEYLERLQETDVCPACGGPLHGFRRADEKGAERSLRSHDHATS